MATKDFINKITCMDCLEGLKQLEDNSIDLIVTDPPYGIDIGSMSFTNEIKGGVAKRTDYRNHNKDWDKEPLKEEILKEILRVGKKIAIFGGNNFANILPNSRGWIVWDKKCEDKYSNDFSDGELIWTNQDMTLRIIRYLWNGMLQKEMGLYKEKRYHPTQKPIYVIKEIIKLLDKEGGGNYM